MTKNLSEEITEFLLKKFNIKCRNLNLINNTFSDGQNQYKFVLRPPFGTRISIYNYYHKAICEYEKFSEINEKELTSIQIEYIIEIERCINEAITNDENICSYLRKRDLN